MGRTKCCFQFEQVTPTVSLNTMLLGRQKQKESGDERVFGVDVRMEKKMKLPNEKEEKDNYKCVKVCE